MRARPTCLSFTSPKAFLSTSPTASTLQWLALGAGLELSISHSLQLIHVWLLLHHCRECYIVRRYRREEDHFFYLANDLAFPRQAPPQQCRRRRKPRPSLSPSQSTRHSVMPTMLESSPMGWSGTCRRDYLSCATCDIRHPPQNLAAAPTAT